MDEPGGHYNEWNKLVTDRQNTARFHLYEVSKIVKLTEAENRMVGRREKWGAGDKPV